MNDDLIDSVRDLTTAMLAQTQAMQDLLEVDRTILQILVEGMFIGDDEPKEGGTLNG